MLQTGETADEPWTNVIDPIDVPKADGGVTVRNFDPLSVQYVRFYIDKVESGQNFFILKTKGDNGQTITWHSSNTAVVLNNGTVIRGANDMPVHITAEITKGDAKAKAEFDIVVLKKPNSYISGGGGTGGGGNNHILTPKSEPEKPTVNDDKVLGMDKSHWAYQYVKKLAEKGVVSGNENGSFEPEKAISRAEYIKLLVTAFEIEEQGSAESFADVSADAWYGKYIGIARSRGIVEGNDENCVMSEERISGQDMAVMLGRTPEILGKTIEKKREYVKFSDENGISSYAGEYIRSLYCAGIIDGTGEGSFAPANSAAKAEAAKIIDAVL